MTNNAIHARIPPYTIPLILKNQYNGLNFSFLIRDFIKRNIGGTNVTNKHNNEKNNATL
jgi:hypothetical protein